MQGPPPGLSRVEARLVSYSNTLLFFRRSNARFPINRRFGETESGRSFFQLGVFAMRSGQWLFSHHDECVMA